MTGSAQCNHPFIEGLLVTLPAAGAVWPIKDREAWFDAAISVFKLLYQDGDGSHTVQQATPPKEAAQQP